MGLQCFKFCLFHLCVISSAILNVVLSTSVTRVAITSCPPNHYALINDHGNGIHSCEECTSCPPGFGVQQVCTSTKNTVCTPCDIDTFSMSTSSTERCLPCRRCGENGIINECTALTDSVCRKQCIFGEFYDPSVDRCTLCSYCFPDRPYARTVRVIDCQLQGLHVDMQCSPLPTPGAGDSWPPPVATGIRNQVMAGVGGPHQGGTLDRGSSDGRGRTESDIRVGMGISADDMGDRRLSTHDLDGGIEDGDHSASRLPLPPADHGDDILDSFSYNDYDLANLGIDQILHDVINDALTGSSREEHNLEPIVSKGGFEEVEPAESSISSDAKMAEDAYSSFSESLLNKDSSQETDYELSQFGLQQYQSEASSSPRWRSLSRTDIVLVVVIALSCGLISFVVTAITCHCLMKRGKNVGPRVSIVSTKRPSNAWTYQDLMPTETVDMELRTLVVDTPPQTRKFTCV